MQYKYTRVVLRHLHLLLFIFTGVGCDFSNKQSDSTNESAQKSLEVKEQCNCGRAAADRLATKIMNEFDESQKYVNSGSARRIRLTELESRPNCDWIANFELYSPFGNSMIDPTIYLKKRFSCDGKEIYSN